MKIEDSFRTIGITGEKLRRNRKSSVLIRKLFGVVWKVFQGKRI